jgi:hypothetical protein
MRPDTALLLHNLTANFTRPQLLLPPRKNKMPSITTNTGLLVMFLKSYLTLIYDTYGFAASSGFVNLTFDTSHLSLWCFHCLTLLKLVIEVLKKFKKNST